MGPYTGPTLHAATNMAGGFGAEGLELVGEELSETTSVVLTSVRTVFQNIAQTVVQVGVRSVVLHVARNVV